MSTKILPSGPRNAYECALELNQNGKYCVRIRASFARTRWSLPLYFLASSFDGAMKKLEQTLQYLQKREEALWFWGVQRSDDPNLTGELLADLGLRLDRRAEFPRKRGEVLAVADRPVSAVQIAPLRRALADTLAPARAASD